MSYDLVRLSGGDNGNGSNKIVKVLMDLLVYRGEMISRIVLPSPK